MSRRATQRPAPKLAQCAEVDASLPMAAKTRQVQVRQCDLEQSSAPEISILWSRPSTTSTNIRVATPPATTAPDSQMKCSRGDAAGAGRALVRSWETSGGGSGQDQAALPILRQTPTGSTRSHDVGSSPAMGFSGRGRSGRLGNRFWPSRWRRVPIRMPGRCPTRSSSPHRGRSAQS